MEDGRVSACLAEERVVRVTDMLSETQERLEFRDRVVMMSAGEAWLAACLSPAWPACSAAGPRGAHTSDCCPRTRRPWHTGFGHLVVCTCSHCHIYSTSNWNTPHIFDLGDRPQLLLQCSRNFVLVDAEAGLQVGVHASLTPRAHRWRSCVSRPLTPRNPSHLPHRC